MKRIFLALAVASVSAQAALAQDAGPAGGPPPVQPQIQKRPGPLMIEREILGKLDLTATQKVQVKDLVAKLAKGVKELREQNKANPDKKVLRDKIADLMRTYHDGLQGILTPEQMEKYKALHQALRDKMRKDAAPTQPGKP